MTAPAFAQAPEIVPATQGEGIQTVQYAPGGPQRQIGQGQTPGHGRQGKFGHRRHGRPTFAGLALRYRQELGLSTQQVDALRKIGMDARRAAIRRGADRKLATLDLLALRMGDTVDMGKVEATVREIEKLRGDGQIARIRANEQAKAQLTAEQRDKLRVLMGERWKAMRESMPQRRRDTR
jgi:Spy/CpxP family protein refolding chaperone